MGFAEQLQAFAQKAQSKADLVVQEFAAEIGERLVNKTPFDTGEAKAGWHAEIGHHSPSKLDATDKDGSATAAKIREDVAGARFGDVVYITNSIPHITSLEDGHSQQAPAGMRDLTVLESPAILASVVAKVKAQ